MKLKIAKRSASQYEESLSSQSSCQDSIITHFQYSSVAGSSQSGQNIMVAQECWTPPKNVIHGEQSFSVKKMVSNTVQEWDVKNNGRARKTRFWGYESQDSKIRSKQDKSTERVSKKYKQHIKMLKFDDERFSYQYEKENQQIRANTQQSSSDSETQQWTHARHILKRVVGKVLYSERNCYKIMGDKLAQIVEEESQVEENTNKVITNF